MHHHLETIASGSGAQTDTEVIGAPAAGNQIIIHGIYISTDTAATVTLEHGSTAIHIQYAGANGGSIAAFAPTKEGLWKIPAATSVTYTTSAAANLAIGVWYDTRAV